jgi:shikimate kinase
VVELTSQNIALIGFMAAGKTRVGEALSSMSGLPFRDIDALVEGIAQLPVHQIFRERGEAYFRRIEAAVLRELCQGSGQIIGCGGGTILLDENRALLRRRCHTVWLRVTEKEVMDRLAHSDSPRRPLLDGLDAELVVNRLMQARDPWYREADYAVEAEGREVEEVAREIAFLLGLSLLPGQGPVGPIR